MSKRRPSGDGMVRKREDGRWEGRIVVDHKSGGAPIFRYVYAATRKELTAKLRQRIELYQGAELTEQSRMTLSEWLDHWLDEIIVRTVRPSPLNGYRSYADHYINPYLGGKQISGSMVHSIHTMLHGAMKAAERPKPGGETERSFSHPAPRSFFGSAKNPP